MNSGTTINSQTDMASPIDSPSLLWNDRSTSSIRNNPEELLHLLKSENIPYGSFGKTYYEYAKHFAVARTDMGHIRQIMDALQTNNEDLVFMGGHTARAGLMGWKENIREASFDIDVYAPNIKTLLALNKFVKDNASYGAKLFYNPEHKYFYIEYSGSPISIAFEDLYGIYIQESYTHIYTDLKMLNPAALSAMKLRRERKNAKTGLMESRKKDLSDIGSLLLAHFYGKVNFDFALHKDIAKIYSEGRDIFHSRNNIINSDGFDSGDKQKLKVIINEDHTPDDYNN